MGELFIFFMSWKNFKYFFLFDPIGMIQQMVYYKEKDQFSENKLFGFYSVQKTLCFIAKSFQLFFFPHQRLVLVFNLLLFSKPWKLEVSSIRLVQK